MQAIPTQPAPDAQQGQQSSKGGTEGRASLFTFVNLRLILFQGASDYYFWGV